MERILDGSLDLTYGEGFIKPFTMFIPRWLWQEKPINYVSYYTANVYPSLWAEGVSLPVLIVSEFFGSMKWLALVVFPSFIFALDKLFLWHGFQKSSLYLNRPGVCIYFNLIEARVWRCIYTRWFGVPFYILLWKS